MSAKMYSLSARRVIMPRLGEVTVEIGRKRAWVFPSPQSAREWASRVVQAAMAEERRAAQEARDKGASPLLVFVAWDKQAPDRAEAIALRHGLDVADVWTKPRPETAAACAEHWARLQIPATDIARLLGLNVDAVRRAIRKTGIR